jgi:general stress protein 26
MWTNSDGEPFGVVMAVLPKDGRFWLTAAERRKRITALRRFPRASLCLNSTGTKMGPGKTITYKGTCTVHADRATKDWFYPEFSRWLHRDEATAAEFQRFLDSPHRVIIEFVPDYSLSFDGELMMQRSPDANW